MVHEFEIHVQFLPEQLNSLAVKSEDSVNTSIPKPVFGRDLESVPCTTTARYAQTCVSY